jgi:hypothetical protein
MVVNPSKRFSGGISHQGLVAKVTGVKISQKPGNTKILDELVGGPKKESYL